jgi:hypothetical protein
MRKDEMKLVCLETGEIFDNVYIASWSQGLFDDDILLCCDGYKKETFGTHWAYYEDLK